MVSVLLLAISLGCKKEEDIENRYLACKERIEDAQEDDIEDTFECWTSKSRAVIEALVKHEKQSVTLAYLESYPRLLDYDDLAAPPEVLDTIAFLPVKKGDKRTVIIMRLEEGEWRIDGLELPGFWLPLNQALESE